MDILELLLGGGGIAALLLTIVQISPIKVNPWSAMFRAIGRAINAEVLERVEALQNKLDGHIKSEDAGNADRKRAFILAFNRQLMNGEKHTREDFWEVLSAIDDYHKYCDAHPEYPNSRAVHAIHNIGRVYDERQRKNDFLPDK